MEKVLLREELKKLEDKRRGQRHTIDVVLMVMIMATMRIIGLALLNL